MVMTDEVSTLTWQMFEACTSVNSEMTMEITN